MRSSGASVHSDESVELSEIIANRQSRIDTLSQLQKQAEHSIKLGIELGEKKEENPFSNYDDDDNEYEDEGGESQEEETLEEEKDSNYDSNYGTAAKDHRPSQTLVTCENDLDDDMERSMSNPYNNGAVLKPKWIGNVRCFLHDANGRPRITVGPNWGFTIFLSALVGGSLYVSISALMRMF